MKTARVVLVEDHTMIRQLFAHLICEELGLELAADCTTAEGRGLLREKPDLAVVDWMLPDGRGFNLVRQVGPRLPRTRWLFVSSNEQGHLVREAVSLGVQGFVMKRADLSTLREAVRRCWQARRITARPARLLVTA
jgi:two-component system response regulator DesR